MLMKPTFNDKLVAYLALLSGLSISAVAIYYSVAGLTAIFAAAVVPIIIMGISLEVSKLIATVWLKQNWHVAPRFLKGYLILSIVILMLITSLGCFGFLSKSHLDQAVPSGEVSAKLLLLDEKIKTQKENIEFSRQALAQLDSQVDQRLTRGTSEQGAERAVQIRRQQAAERTKLQKEIGEAQRRIELLNEERAPIASQMRKVEAEVGPIKYIASFFYGTSDPVVLEKAVTWVIILLIIVFDPLAVILLLASQVSFQRFREYELENSKKIEIAQVTETSVSEPAKEEPKSELTEPEVVEPETAVTNEITQNLEVSENVPTSENTENSLAVYETVATNEFIPEGINPDELVKDVQEDKEVIVELVPESVPEIKTESSIQVEEPKKVIPPVPSMVWVEKNPPLVKVFPRPAPVIPEGYIQNEEQQESNLWSSTVENVLQPEDYKRIAMENREKQINELVIQVKTKRIGLEEVPEELQEVVRARV